MENPVLWILGNMSAPIFGHSDILELAGPLLTSDTLQNWANRGLVETTMQGGKRRYDTMRLTQICLAQPFIHKIGLSPLQAMLMVNMGVSLVIRKLVDPKKVKPKDGDVPLDRVHQFCLVYRGAGEVPLLINQKQISETVLREAEVLLVHPFGRHFVDLARRAQQIADSRRVVLVAGFEEAQERALAAAGEAR